MKSDCKHNNHIRAFATDINGNNVIWYICAVCGINYNYRPYKEYAYTGWECTLNHNHEVSKE